MEDPKAGEGGFAVPEEEASKKPLEARCMGCLMSFKETGDPTLFHSFYRLSYPLFFWYTRRLLNEEKTDLDPERILARFYGFLSEEALSPLGRLPEEGLLDWCKAALANLVELYVRAGGEGAHTEGTALAERIRPIPSEVGLREKMLSEEARISEGIAEVLARGDAGLSRLEGEVLSAFYGNGRDLSAVSRQCGLDEAFTRRVLACARGKVYRAFFEGPGRFLSTRERTVPEFSATGEVEG